jgi:hypothetical protein
MRRYFTLLVVGCLALVGCGGSDDDKTETTPKATPAAAANVDLTPIKDYLLEHTDRLVTSTELLQRDAQEYYNLAEAADFDYAKMLKDNREEVQTAVKELQGAHIQANPAYEEMEGVVAGVPSLADYDVIIDAGADKSDPENAAPITLKTPAGKTWDRPGNFNYLIETSAYGTEPKFAAKGVEPDLDGDGKVSFGEAVPDADFYVTAAREFEKTTKELDAAAKEWTPTAQDAFTALVVMTPTMSEYFDAWKNSRFVAGNKAEEKAFVAASRLQDIADILGGLETVYAAVQPSIASVDGAQATQTKADLSGLTDFAARLRDEEAGGKQFTADEAETLGTEAQSRAEAIAGQVSQAAGKLDIKLES